MHAFRALRHRDYALYFSGQLVSWVGTWMQSVAVAWMVHRITGQPAWLGIVAFASQAPSFLLAPVGGVVAVFSMRHVFQRWEFLRAILPTAAGMLATLLGVELVGKLLGKERQTAKQLIIYLPEVQQLRRMLPTTTQYAFVANLRDRDMD